MHTVICRSLIKISITQNFKINFLLTRRASIRTSFVYRNENLVLDGEYDIKYTQHCEILMKYKTGKIINKGANTI